MDKPLHYHLGVVLLISGGLLLSACDRGDGKETLKKVTFGLGLQPSTALAHIAIQKSFFVEQGLDVTPTYFVSGKRTMVDGLLTGKVAYIATADVPYVWKSFEHEDLKVLASIYKADNMNRVVARKDAGITTFKDLKGKRVGTQKESAVHYFLHSVMISESMAEDDIDLSFHKAGELPLKLAAGDIDAFSMREPYISQAVELLGKDNATVLAAPGVYLQNELLVAREDTIESDPEVAVAIMRALLMAEKFARENPDEAINLLATILKIDPASIKAVWNDFEFIISLEHTLLFSLDREADWLAGEMLPQKAKVPDFSRRFYTPAIEAVKPEAMLLLR